MRLQMKVNLSLLHLILIIVIYLENDVWNQSVHLVSYL